MVINALNYFHFKIKREKIYRERKKDKRDSRIISDWKRKKKGAQRKIHLEKSTRGQSNYEGK